MLGKFTNSFAPRLGKIGHTLRGDAAGTHTGELRNLVDQMGLMAVMAVPSTMSSFGSGGTGQVNH